MTRGQPATPRPGSNGAGLNAQAGGYFCRAAKGGDDFAQVHASRINHFA